MIPVHMYALMCFISDFGIFNCYSAFLIVIPLFYLRWSIFNCDSTVLFAMYQF